MLTERLPPRVPSSVRLQLLKAQEQAASNWVLTSRESISTGYTGADLPTGVTFSGTFHDGQHGYSNAILSVPTDGGAVKFTISGCQYANPATFPVKNAAGETLATLNQKEAGCYDAGGIITYI